MSTKSNRFSSKVISKSNEELIAIVQGGSYYQENFKMAALWELQNRGELPTDLQEVLDQKEKEIKAVSTKSSSSTAHIFQKAPWQYKWASFGMYLIFVLELIGILVIGREMEMHFNGLYVPGAAPSLIAGILLHLGRTWARFIVLFISFFSLGFHVATEAFQIDIIGSLQVLVLLVVTFLLFSKTCRIWYKSLV